jgi:hypothetical protein
VISWPVYSFFLPNTTKIEDFESIWPLFIPPLMTLLDDYDPPFKIRGIHILNEMLKPVDPKLLKRTGIDTLLFSVCPVLSVMVMRLRLTL